VRRLAAILLWSVIAAAFIGPGTVTTAAAAGAGFGLALLWTLVFSTVACLVLQEASARLTLVSGRNLGQALRHRYPTGFTGTAVLLLVLGAIVLGCAAYEAGNILGGVAGAVLATGRSPKLLALASGVIAGLLLWFNRPRRVAHLLSIVVAVMGVAFLFTAFQLRPQIGEILRGALVPALPAGSALLAIGLVGTTVVPYNIFLGSGIAAGQSLGELRLGLAVAIGLGGLISMGVLVAGTAVDGEFTFQALSR
jgi:NRAMP (natural resistance-associated macrophage protein)-like metal ion transporter